MADEQSKKRLGRGLAALIGDMDKPVVSSPSPSALETKSATQEQVSGTVQFDRTVPIETIKANPNNPRRSFTADELEDLANSISEHGIVQPVLVRPSPGVKDNWELIAGERRWRAAQKAGLHMVPIVVRDVDDRQALELAIIENVQRADLNPVEEAQGYQQLMDDHDYKQVELAKVIGKSRSHVANTLRLLRLPQSVCDLLADGRISPGHARTLITLDRPEKLAQRIVDEGLSVRDAERLAAMDEQEANQKPISALPKAVKDSDTLALEKKLSDVLGLKVEINHKATGRGKITIGYKTLEQLDELERKLS